MKDSLKTNVQLLTSISISSKYLFKAKIESCFIMFFLYQHAYLCMTRQKQGSYCMGNFSPRYCSALLLRLFVYILNDSILKKTNFRLYFFSCDVGVRHSSSSY